MRVVIAAAQGLIRAGLKRLVEERPNIQVVAVADSGTALLEAVRRSQPDAVLSEFDLPQLSGLEALARIRREAARTAMLMLTGAPDAQLLRAAVRLGARGIVDMAAEPGDLYSALSAAQRQQLFISPTISHYLATPPGQQQPDQATSLSQRQRQVLQMIGRGNSTREIASEMGVSVKTVETHRARMMDTLGIHGTHALMRYAIRIAMGGARI